MFPTVLECFEWVVFSGLDTGFGSRWIVVCHNCLMSSSGLDMVFDSFGSCFSLLLHGV